LLVPPHRDSGLPVRSHRYYDLLVGAFVAVLLCSNLIGPAKTVGLHLPVIGDVTFGAGNLFFPIAYIFADVFTEVYGYAAARRAIWVGFGALLFSAVMGAVVVGLPPAASEPFNGVLQPALELVFGNTWRIVLASLVAYWIGDFINSYVMAKMKVATEGKYLWTRTIGSTVVGQLVDSIIFYPLAFGGVWVTSTLVQVVLFNWVMKVTVEAVFTPVTYLVVNAFKRAEGEDHFDRDTNFTPFSLKNE
jgi:uncharacterized integral membrane protein (TIGR00697 family)